MLRKPFTLLSCVRSGLSIERGTLPRPAWCSTTSTDAQAALQVSSARISPSTKRKFFQRASPAARRTSSRFSRFPVEKLSRPTTFWSSASRRSTRCEPMKPAAPVTSQRRWPALTRANSSSCVFTYAPCRFEFEKQVFVALHHRLLREALRHGRPRRGAHAAAHAGLGKLRQALDQPRHVADRVEKAVVAVADHLGGPADVRMHHRALARHRLERGEGQSLRVAAQDEHVARCKQPA